MCHKARPIKKTMKLKKLIITALLAIAGVGWGLPSAHALVWNTNDLLVGFRATGGQGQSVSYLVNIGSGTTYLSSGEPITLSFDIGADLINLYGAEWYNRADLQWSIFGRNEANDTLWASRERTNVGTQSSAWPTLSTPAFNPTTSNVAAVITAFQNGALDPSAPVIPSSEIDLSSIAGSQNNNGTARSYNFQVSGATAFGTTSQWGAEFQGNFGDGVEGTVLDLYRVRTSGVVYRGYFSIDELGTISFNNPAAVPEPSTYALFAAAGVFFFVFLRRRKAAITAAA